MHAMRIPNYILRTILILAVVVSKCTSGFSLMMPSPTTFKRKPTSNEWRLYQSETDGARRRILIATGSSLFIAEPALAAAKKRQSLLFMVSTKNATSAESLRTSPVDDVGPSVLSSERCLLELLPVKNPVFLKLVAFVDSLNVLRSTAKPSPSSTAKPFLNPADLFKAAYKTMGTALEYLDNQRRQLEPIFDQEDSTLKQIRKGERGELLAEALREELVALMNSTKYESLTETLALQKRALLVLADIGELLVGAFPYDVPTEGKFANLPRLRGRARVTFGFKRGNEILGNVTIIADGFAAPITAGNFVDLSVRNFYTGLPLKTVKKRLGEPATVRTGFFGLEAYELETDEKSTSVLASVPILGSYREGFFDPLTAKLRRIPLEIVRVDKSLGVSKLSYARGFSELSSDEASIGTFKNNKPLLSFDIPGLVALNHPDRFVNGGSSEFFSLQATTLESDEDRALLDGQYAPFGYIIEGFDLFQSLQPNDVIESTTVGEWGQGNLVKVKGNSFSDVLGGLDDEGA
jgi:peptidylprolyl isomerase